MGSSNIFGILGTGTSGIMASQIAMDIAGDNIANANTEGYSRKRLVQQAMYRKDSGMGAMGYGVFSSKVERYRDEYLDTKISSVTSEYGQFKQLDIGMTRVEDILLEPQDTGIKETLNKFWNTWQDLSNNPHDTASRSVVVKSAETLIKQIKSAVTNLRDYQNDLNNEMESTIDQVNVLTKEITKLNKDIITLELNDKIANDSRDLRDRAIRDLSELIEIDYTQDETGSFNVTVDGILVSSGQSQVDLIKNYEFDSRYDGTTRKSVGIKFAAYADEMEYNSGQLEGYRILRDDVIEDKLEKLDYLAVSIKESINEIHKTGYNLEGMTGISFFKENSVGAMDMEVDSTIVNNVNFIAAATGSTSLIATDTITALASPDTFGVPLQFDAIQRTNLLEDTIVVTNNLGPTRVELVEGDDYTVDYQRGTITLLSPSATPPGGVLNVEFEYRVSDSKGIGDGGNALAIASLQTSKTMTEDILGNTTQTYGEYYGAIIGEVGAEKQDYNSSFTNIEFMKMQFEKRQDDISGVSLDEEMTNLIKFQHSYQASSRIIATVEKMLDALINLV